MHQKVQVYRSITGQLVRFGGRGLLALSLGIAAACGGGRAGGPPAGRAPGPEPSARTALGPQYDAIGLFRRLGLLARGAPMPFVGSVSFFATPSPDSTHVLVAVSLSNAALTFGRENDRFRAGYTITISVKNGAESVRNIEAHENVVVASFKETTRTDESVLYEEIITVPPGRYDFTVAVRDDGSARTTEDAATLAVPALGASGLSTPVSFARAGMRTRLSALPQIIANPTGGATFGRDSIVPFVVEAYGGASGPRLVQYIVRAENGRGLYRDSVELPSRGGLHAGVINVPISRVGIGAMTLAVWAPGAPDTTRAPFFVGFGGDLPLASFEEMLNYLRWFAPTYRLQALKDTASEHRPAAWAAFVREYTDPSGQSDALREYFTRLLEANTRFREETMPGWQTDRGKVLLGLGRPDQVYEQMGRGLNTQGRQQVWEYRRFNLALTFYDQNGFGRWKLTTSSESDFMTAWRQRVQ
jgi:GWxTD domain-containing protein